MRSRRAAAIAAAGVAAGLALSALLLTSWGSLVIWARLSGVKEVHVQDVVLGEHMLVSSSAVLHAAKETGRFIASLAPRPLADVEKVGYWSQVAFRSGEGWSGAPYLQLTSFEDDEKAVFVFCGSRYLGDRAEWYRYLGRMLLPARASLEAAWRARRDKVPSTLDVAAALLLIAPNTEGVLEFVCRRASTDMRALRILAICADRSEALAGCLETLADAPGTPPNYRAEINAFLKTRRSTRESERRHNSN